MNLESLQTSLSELIKSRHISAESNDDYINKVKSSENLLLIKKIAFWWRKIQVEQYGILTTNLLKITGQFDEQLSNFISDAAFSSFREEVGHQFLDYVISTTSDPLTRAVAEFESAIIKLKLGDNIETKLPWPFEPYGVISGLLKNTLKPETLETGNYEVEISYKHQDELFKVRHL